MTEYTQNLQPPLEVKDFEIHAVYGVHFNIPTDSQNREKWYEFFEQKKKDSVPIREGWTPIYREHCSAITEKIDTPDWCKSITVVHPKFFSSGKPKNEPKPSIKMKVSRWLTIREDGATAITIRLKADRQKSDYDLADILASLLLPPRIIRGIKLDDDKNHCKDVKLEDMMATTSSKVYELTADANPEPSCALLDSLATDDNSSLFKLFLGAIKEVISENPFLTWSEYCPSNTGKSTTKKAGRENSQGQEILPWGDRDLQIPYFAVFATVPNSIYDNAFLETGAEYSEKILANRQKYTRHIAAILFRWLTPHNANYISLDFLESLGLLYKGSFVNKYVNSLSFVTYSSTGALCLKPQFENSHSSEELGPQHATYGSILRCVELSRLRWHHALRLSRRLDDLTKRVIHHAGAERFDDFIAELLDIRAEAAQHFLDPLTYQWDATVGSDIAKFLQGDVIERVEEECIKKLNMVKQLLHEKLDVLQLRDIQDELEDSSKDSKL